MVGWLADWLIRLFVCFVCLFVCFCFPSFFSFFLGGGGGQLIKS